MNPRNRKRIIAAFIMILLLGAAVLSAAIKMPAWMAYYAADERQPDEIAVVAATQNNFKVATEMLPGCCFAAPYVEWTEKLSNPRERISGPHKVMEEHQGDGLLLIAQPNADVPMIEQMTGMQLLLINQTSQKAEFAACNLRLGIYQEARDENGIWRPIEYLPRSWCGNSYFNIGLEPGYFWQFPVPRYQGSLKTKLRFTLNLNDGSRIHSNEFDGSVNPQQFKIPSAYDLEDIMSPYPDLSPRSN